MVKIKGCLKLFPSIEYIKTIINGLRTRIESVEKIRQDWNQNDTGAKNYIKNRTHFVSDNGTVHKLDYKYLPVRFSTDQGKDLTGDVIISEEDINPNNGEYYSPIRIDPSTGMLSQVEKNFVPQLITKSCQLNINGVSSGQWNEYTTNTDDSLYFAKELFEILRHSYSLVVINLTSQHSGLDFHSSPCVPTLLYTSFDPLVYTIRICSVFVTDMNTLPCFGLMTVESSGKVSVKLKPL